MNNDNRFISFYKAAGAAGEARQGAIDSGQRRSR